MMVTLSDLVIVNGGMRDVDVMNPRHVRIVEAEAFFSTEYPSGTLAFGASTVNELTFAHMRVRVEDGVGRSAIGWGAVFLSHPWAYPGGQVVPTQKDAIMRALLTRAGQWAVESNLRGHPLDHFLAIEPELNTLASMIAREHRVGEDIPRLASLVSISPLDAAIHDAYGNLHGCSSYDLLTVEAIGWDLTRVLGIEFSGKAPFDYLRAAPVARLPIAHTVGAVDPVGDSDAGPGTIAPLREWIESDGVRSFKVKLKGQDLNWDIQRIVSVYRVAQATLGDAPIEIFADLNEQAPSVEYMHAWLDGVQQTEARAFAALDAVEQPLSRNQGINPQSLASVSSRIPVVLDEGLTSLRAIDNAIEHGWTGVALKTCKTQSLMLLALPIAVERGLHVSVQDLTHPGIALLQSAGLAARLPLTRPLEANARQYYPRSSVSEATVWPEIFHVHDGVIDTGLLGGNGFGYEISRISRPIFLE